MSIEFFIFFDKAKNWLNRTSTHIFCIISDFGNAWSNDRESQEMIITTGYEWRISLNIGNAPFLIFSYGLAQEQEKWTKDIDPKPYFQTTLINPF